MSRREEAKDERRRRIITAARDLIRETGDMGLSMRAIAARANVSLSTPYNLFGSKRAIVVAVLEDIREFHERFAKLRSVNAVERVFQAHSPTIDSVTVKRKGKVRGAKLYYLRGLEGKAARIKEDVAAAASIKAANIKAAKATAAE